MLMTATTCYTVHLIVLIVHCSRDVPVKDYVVPNLEFEVTALYPMGFR